MRTALLLLRVCMLFGFRGENVVRVPPYILLKTSNAAARKEKTIEKVGGEEVNKSEGI